MTKYAAFLVIVACLVSHSASAQCVNQTLTPTQRAAMSSIVFEGTITATSCQCNELGADEDEDGPEVFCTDTVKPSRAIKGDAQYSYDIESSAMLDSDPNKVLSDDECVSRVSNRHDRLVGTIDTFYLRLVDNFYQYAPTTACR
jgi:hypothetical protein